MSDHRMPIHRLTEDEMREVVRDRLACKVMFSSEVPRNLVGMVFGCGMLGASLRPPADLVESLLGSSQPPEVLEGEPERPENPGYPPEPEPPVKPTLTKVSERVEFDHRWGKISEEDYAALCAEIKAENTRRVREWEDATDAWHKALDAYAQARREINAAHEAAVEAWQASLDQHAEAVEAREAARLEWELGYEEHFADWTADVGVLVGDMSKTFPRSINGFPIFHAFLPLHKDDWKRIEAAIVREQDRAIDV